MIPPTAQLCRIVASHLEATDWWIRYAIIFSNIFNQNWLKLYYTDCGYDKNFRYYFSQLSLVWNGDPTADPFTQQNIATRFVSVFGLQNEAVAAQTHLNSALNNINSILGYNSPSPNPVANTVSRKVFSYISRNILIKLSVSVE